jgi:septal ring factor EnvC (AmiA/AmiB activator)
VMYDRLDVGWIFLWCLFLGGPLFFWFLSREDHERNEEFVLQKVNERTKHVRERLSEKERDLSQIIATKTEGLKGQIAELNQSLSQITAENRVLKARLEFSPDIPRPPEAQKTNGVLDQDLF